MAKTKCPARARVFSIISAAVYAIFAAHALYLFIKRAEMLCREIVMDLVDDKYYVTAPLVGFRPEAIPAVVAACLIALTLIILIVRVIRPNLLFGIVGSFMTALSCGVFLFSDLRFEIFMMFRYVYGLTSRDLPLIEMCDWFKIIFVFLVTVGELITLAVIIASIKRKQTLQDILKGKKLSVFGASMCTYDGYSNNTEHNSTIGKNKAYYGTPESENVKCRDMTVNETFWGRLIEKYDMTICVNNSWSGSKVLDDNPEAAGWNTRPAELHRDDGMIPDIIVSFMGNNDLSKERPAGEVSEELFNHIEREVDSNSEYIPQNFAEGYAMMVYKMTKRYPSAKIFLFNMPWRTPEKNELLLAYNEIINKTTSHYGAYVVNLTDSVMSGLDYAKYTCDGKLHPNSDGMRIWAELIEDAFKVCYQ